MKRRQSKQRLNKNEQLLLGVKNFLTFQGFTKEQQIEVVNIYISTCEDYRREDFPKARNDEEAKTAYIITGFPQFVAWVNQMVQEA